MSQPSAGSADGSASPRGFDFTRHMRLLCEDITRRGPQLRHIDMQRVAVSLRQARKRVKHGMWAALIPLRFENGACETVRRGRRYGVQRAWTEDGHEALYIVNFYLPRYLQLSFHEKLTTVFHELWHISPEFNGDLRRHSGRCFAHSPSQKQYDAHVEQLTQEWLALAPPPPVYDFLRCDFSQLQQRHGAVYGTRFRDPKLIPLAADRGQAAG